MKVLVAVKEVADVDDDFELDGTAVDPDYLQYGLNEWDEYAVEEAARIAEAGEDVETVSVTVGPERAEETIRMALAKGIDRAVRVWDDPIADADLLDVGAKVRLLRAVVEAEDPDLVLTGVQASDDGFGATGVALANAVGYGWAAVVNDLDLALDAGAGVAHVHRELEGGVEELTEVDLPAVLTIQTGINEPRYASLRGIRGAQSKELALRDLDDLGLTAADVAGDLRLTGMFEPESDSDTQYFEGGPAEQAAGLAVVLRDRGVGAE
jgi:electron transfer flavoprotein beta subunit